MLRNNLTTVQPESTEAPQQGPQMPTLAPTHTSTPTEPVTSAHTLQGSPYTEVQPPRATFVLQTGCWPDADGLVRWAEGGGDALFNLRMLVHATADALAVLGRKGDASAIAET